MIIKNIKIILVILLYSFCCGCEVLYGVTCATSIALTWDKTLDNTTLPTATVGEYYEFTLTHPADRYYMDWIAYTKKEDLPTGLELIAVETLEENIENRRHITDWVIKGIPTKAGKYKFYMKGISFRTMCGDSDYYYPYTLEVLSANK